MTVYLRYLKQHHSIKFYTLINLPFFISCVLLNEDGGKRVFDTECETLVEDQIIGAKEDLGAIEKEQDLIIKLILVIYKHT